VILPAAVRKFARVLAAVSVAVSLVAVFGALPVAATPRAPRGAVAPGTVTLWRLDLGQSTWSSAPVAGDGTPDIAMSPVDDSLVVAAGYGLSLSQAGAVFAGTESATPLTTNRSDGGPAWSADGTRIVFGREDRSESFDTKEGPFYNSKLWIASIGKGTRPSVREVMPDTGYSDDEPTWSPDGKHIAFSRWHGALAEESQGIYVVNANGSGLKRLTHSNDREPAWSPDGTKIAYFSALGRCESDPFIMNADGTEQRPLPNAKCTFMTSPAWSPDGTHIAWDVLNDPRFVLVVTRADGSEPVFYAGPTGTTSLYMFGGPTWSRDSTYLYIGCAGVGGRACVAAAPSR
jgi:hypothetical protein